MKDTAFSAACATGNDWHAACTACMDRLDAIPGNANLGFIYLTDTLAAHLDSILEFDPRPDPAALWRSIKEERVGNRPRATRFATRKPRSSSLPRRPWNR